MMRLLLIASLIMLQFEGYSQSIYDSISNIKFTLDDAIGDKLAELAVIKNPEAKIYDHRADADMYEWKRQRLEILSRISATFNLNEANIRKADPTLPAIIYPRYNFSLSLPLGTILNRGNEVKRARATYESSMSSRDAQVNALKGAVRRAYQTYLANRHLLTLQESILQDEYILFSQTQDKFQKNQLTLETFTNASKRYNGELAKKLTLVRDVGMSRIDLELLINMDLVEAMVMVAPKGRRTPATPASR